MMYDTRVYIERDGCEMEVDMDIIRDGYKVGLVLEGDLMGVEVDLTKDEIALSKYREQQKYDLEKLELEGYVQ
tara:strand:- start:1407 stop:1625 length:219 start_codon:yes stop_codon:yes gene_type:complete